MTGDLLKVMLCAPDSAGWNEPAEAARWEEFGFLHAPETSAAAKAHEALVQALAAIGAEVLALTGAPASGLDSVYVHDASLVTDWGAVCLRMGKSQRQSEPAVHRMWYESCGIPVLGEILSPGTAEAGDMIWLDPATLLVGRGYRTNRPGLRQLQALLSVRKIEVLPAPLPHGVGPSGCLHLMSLLSVLDERTILADLPLLAVETVELLLERGFRLVEIDHAERASLACNVLALGQGRLLAFEENSSTNRRLREAGFTVTTIEGREIGINGGGGPTCLTRPILRSQS